MSGDLLIGLMSGTSVDGIDASLVSFQSDSDLEVIDNLFTPFDDDLRAQIIHTALNSNELERCDDSPLHSSLAAHYAHASLELIKKAGVLKDDISAIANHGQTVRHEPNAAAPFSLQLGDAQLIAQHTGIRTIGQFRQADLAAGGQGAPLMPAFHKAVLDRSNGQVTEPGIVLNIGGIANITRLGEPVIGFDTGPGNTLLDQWIERHQQQPYDADGAWAKGGTVLEPVLNSLLKDPYIAQAYPKSTGTDYFNLTWLSERAGDVNKYQPQDIQATLLAFTVKSIAQGLSQINSEQGRLYVCGGGAHNKALMKQLRIELPNFSVMPTDELGVPSDWVEAVGFAWLGYCRLHNIPSNLPNVTGANSHVILGEIFEPK